VFNLSSFRVFQGPSSDSKLSRVLAPFPSDGFSMTLETSRSYFEASVAREPQKALKVLNAIRREEVERSLILFTYRIHLRSIMLRTPLSRLFFINVSTCSAARSAGTGEIHGLWAKVFETGLNLDD